ncbi:hypothetical protein PtB15_9B335 [Puccinia triticina]|nr:hypothetical protein PtB15_9B335 [Puccinia triticina]
MSLLPLMLLGIACLTHHLPEASAAPHAWLNPKESVLATEVQEITADKFNQSIKAAQRSAQAILSLKLPRSCKRKAEDLVASITRSRRRWEATGIFPNDEEIKIAAPCSPSKVTTPAAKILKKRSRTKQATKPTSVKPVDLLDKTISTIPTVSVQPPTLIQEASPATNRFSPWEDEPLEPNSHKESSTAASMSQPLTDQASNATPNDHNSETKGRTLPPPCGTPDNAYGAPPDLNKSTNTVSTTATVDLALPCASSLTPDPAGAGVTTSRDAHSPPPFNHETDSSAPGIQNATTTHTNAPSAAGSEAPGSSPHPNPTIIKSDKLRAQLISISQEFTGSKPSWSKYVSTWKALSPLLQTCAAALQNAPPASAPFHLQPKDFLSPSHQEQWYCPDLIDFPLLTKFGDKSNPLPPGTFIPTLTKTPHPESALVRCLYRLHHPPPYVTTDWAKIVAASVELTAENLFKPPPVSPDPTANHITKGFAALCYLKAIKNSSSTFDPPSDQADASSQTTPRFHSADVLHNFRNVIIDVMMAYIILQTHSFSDAPLTPAQKKANNRANRGPTNDLDRPASENLPNASTVALSSADAVKHLQKYQKKQKFQPLVYYSLGGAISTIKQHSTTAHTFEEPIWRSVSSCLVKMFAPLFESPDSICSLASVKVPTRFQLAEAITTDFLNHWKTLKPTSPFLLPHEPNTITGD